MRKRDALLLFYVLAMTTPASAQWTNWDTQNVIRGVIGTANAAIESAERKKEMEILARQKVEFEQSFKDAMTEAKSFEAMEKWEDALGKYEEAAKLNCKFSYTDQHTLSKKITSLYVKAGHTEDGPSILNNDKVTLTDYSAYRYMRENPVFVNKKNAAGISIVRVACSDSETRVEFEVEALRSDSYANISGKTYIKGNKGGKLELVSAQNIPIEPARTYIPWLYQKLRFALIFPALPEEAKKFDLIVPSSVWQFKDIKCK